MDYVKLAIGNAETETWFIDSFEEWRKAKNLSNFILLGHSFGGYVAAKYALKVINIPHQCLNSRSNIIITSSVYDVNFLFHV